MRFFNSIGTEGQLLIQFEKKVSKQNELVLAVFSAANMRGMTPFEVQKELLKDGKDYPITSIRRAITTLTDEGYLVKLGEMRQGEYGVVNHTWRVR
jgi:Fe2+ or Zn2+ uptake regulation protein